MNPQPIHPEASGDELRKQLADIIGCEYLADDDGFEGYDWFHQEPETGALHAMGEGALQLERLEKFVQAHIDAECKRARVDELSDLYDNYADRTGRIVTTKTAITKRIMKLEQLSPTAESGGK